MAAARLARARGFTLIELLVALFITAIMFTMGYGAINQALKDRDSLEARQNRLAAVQNAVRVLVQDFTQLTPRPVRDELGIGSLPCLMGSPNGISLAAGAESAGNAGDGLGGGTGLGGNGPGAAGLGGTGLGATGLGGNGLDSSFGSTGSGSSSSADSSSSAGDEAASGSGDANSDSGQQSLDLVVFTRAGWANPAGIQRPALARVAYRLHDGTLQRLVWPELDAAQATPPVVRDLLDHVKSVRFRFMTDARQWTDQWPPFTTIASSALGGDQTLRMRPLAVEVTLVLDDWGTIVRVIEVPT